MGLVVPVKARVGRSGGRYTIYIIDDSDNEFLRGFLGRRVTAHIREAGISVRVTLTLNKTFRTPRVMAYLPTAMDPTWARYYDRVFTVLIEIDGDVLQPIGPHSLGN